MNNVKPPPAVLPQMAFGHTSEQEAIRITHEDDVPELSAFVMALKMKTPISTDRAATLLEHMVKQQTSSDSSQLADQMRDDGWEADLSDGETLAVVADDALAYLATHEGIALFNFFVRTFARTSGTMFD